MVIIFFTSCSDSVQSPTDGKSKLMEIPEWFSEIEFPEGNEFTFDRWVLGKRLFYDPVLSKDSTVSCASCHKFNISFSDDVPVSFGVENRQGTRNAPSLANVAYHPYYLREGGVPTLEMQVLVPIDEHLEFDFNIVEASERLNRDEEYISMSLKAYGRIPDPYVITRAIANFERSLISGNSPFDDFYYAGNPSALSQSEINGMDIFFGGKGKCINCHSGFNLTNYKFENNGLYENYDDPGRKRLTGQDSDFALFKVPSLRNVGLTAPYMHNGKFASLEDVIEHYNSGGAGNRQKSRFIKPLGLTEREKKDLIAFLHSLTDENFINNNNFRP